MSLYSFIAEPQMRGMGTATRLVTHVISTTVALISLVFQIIFLCHVTSSVLDELHQFFNEDISSIGLLENTYVRDVHLCISSLI